MLVCLNYCVTFFMLCVIIYDFALNCYYCRSYSECNHNNTNKTCDDSRSNICLAFPPCSMKIESHRRGKNIWFYKQGISGRDEMAGNGWQLHTLESFIKMFNETDVSTTTMFPSEIYNLHQLTLIYSMEL